MMMVTVSNIPIGPVLSYSFPGVEIQDFTEINRKININDFEIPEDFNLEAVISAITTVSVSELLN